MIINRIDNPPVIIDMSSAFPEKQSEGDATLNKRNSQGSWPISSFVSLGASIGNLGRRILISSNRPVTKASNENGAPQKINPPKSSAARTPQEDAPNSCVIPITSY